ncbi:MAG: gliding motility-associated C-terminal domain-containing protein [Ginsengibacter sp.]
MKKLTVLFFAVCIFYTAFADTFIVTSNADSGPGSLREAIKLANGNGTAVTDYIHFNISSATYNQRIIQLVTELPSLSSNITIDGTTQPGLAYGTTDAKICLMKNDYAPSFSMMRVENASKVKIFGLHLYYGYWQGAFSMPFRSSQLYGVNIINSTNIEIGGPSKGNVITGVEHGIYSNSENCSDILIKSNYIGLGKFYDNTGDDIDPVVLGSECCITLANVKNITIGGITAAEGNILGTSLRAINIDSKYSEGNGFLLIQFNLFGCFYDKTTLYQSIGDFWSYYITIGRNRNSPVNWTLDNFIDYKIDLLDNNIPAHASFSFVSGMITVLRNRFAKDYRTSNLTVKLAFYRCPGKTIVGNENEADGNYFLTKNLNTDYTSLAIIDCGPVTIGKNVFECNSSLGSTTVVGNGNNKIPSVQISNTTDHSVSGTAAPDTKIDLYYDDECTACEGKKFLGTTNADGAGNWKYEGPVSATVVAIATSSEGYSSEFSRPRCDVSKAIQVYPTCGKNNGSVTGLTAEGADAYFWLNMETGDTVSRSLNLLNAGVGKYLLYGVHGGTCISYFDYADLEDHTPKIYTNNANANQPSCGLSNGSIMGINLFYSLNSDYKWINSKDETIGTQWNIGGLSEGTYRFVAVDTTPGGGCSDTATFVLKNLSGPTLNTTNIKITSATCNNNNGSIGGITATNATGIPFIQWLDSLNNPAGNGFDLENVLPGKYRLQFKDETGCDTIITPYYLVPGKGNILIDTSGKLVTASKCSGVSGSIQQLQVMGGDAFQWINLSDNSIAGASLNVFNLAPGNYQLKVINNLGCSNESPVITVPQADFDGISVTDFTSKNAMCGEDNGAIKINNFDKDPGNYIFHWVDSTSTQTMGVGTSLNNLNAGGYLLFAKDNNGCEKEIFSTHISGFPVPDFDYSAVINKDDNCNLNKGSVSHLKVNGLIGPSAFTWYDQYNNIAGNSPDLQNAGAGTYVLKITDGGVCNIQSHPFVITNTNYELEAPLYQNLTIPRYADAAIVIQNGEPGDYNLWADATGSVTLQQNNNGNFIIPKIAADASFYIQLISGSCSAPVVKVNIKVVDKSYFAIPNAFTPNGDGLNDRLSVQVIGSIKLDYFKIYNQWGELIYETHRLNDGWDGFRAGILQNPGVFVWIARGKDINGNVITDKGSFVLIR